MKPEPVSDLDFGNVEIPALADGHSGTTVVGKQSKFHVRSLPSGWDAALSSRLAIESRRFHQLASISFLTSVEPQRP